MQHTYFVPRNRTKLTTRGCTSPDGVEMTLIRETSGGEARGSGVPLEDVSGKEERADYIG